MNARTLPAPLGNMRNLQASMLATVSNMMTELLTTEGARRRARLEIEREATKPALATVTPADDFRNRLGIAT